ncbi:hypothetical protein CPB85DRAFT_1251443 [Mucidula mucida]|nr:hypothetical protein CPB85DRAFT_1251443 [Mucidula mucida]
MAPRSSKKQTPAPSASASASGTQAAAAIPKNQNQKNEKAAPTKVARGKKGKKGKKAPSKAKKNVVDATVSDPPPTPAVTVQDDFSDLKPNDIRVIEAGIQEMSSKFVDLYPGGVTEEEEYPVEDQEKYDLRRARLVLLKKRTPAFPRPCSMMRTRGRMNLDGVAEREGTALQYASWTKDFDGPNNAAKKFPRWWDPIDKFLFEQCWNDNIPVFMEKNGGREGRPWESQTDEYRESQLKQYSSAQLWGVDYDSEIWPSAQSEYTDPEGVVHNVGAEWVKFQEAEMKKEEEEVGRPIKSCLVVKDADETSTVVRESSADDTLVEDGELTSDSRSSGVRFATPPTTAGSKRRRDEEEEEEVEDRSSRRRRTDGGE